MPLWCPPTPQSSPPLPSPLDPSHASLTLLASPPSPHPSAFTGDLLQVNRRISFSRHWIPGTTDCLSSLRTYVRCRCAKPSQSPIPPCLRCAPRPATRLTAGGARARQRMGPHNPSPDPTPKHAAHAATYISCTVHHALKLADRSGAEDDKRQGSPALQGILEDLLLLSAGDDFRIPRRGSGSSVPSRQTR